MGALTDLLKDIPLVAVLREKITEFEAKQATLETENAILKDDLRQAKAEIVKLKKEVANLKDETERLTHVDVLDEPSVQILARLAKDGGLVDGSDLVRPLKLHAARVKHLMDKLEQQGYIEGQHYAGGEISLYNLTPKGREYAVKSDLIP